MARNETEINSDHPHCDKCGQPLVNVDHLRKENQELQTVLDDLNTKYKASEKVTLEADAKCKKIQDDCEVELNKLRADFSVIQSSFTEKKNAITAKINVAESKKTELEKLKISELDNVDTIYRSKWDRLKVEYDAKITEVSSSILVHEKSIEVETNNMKQKLVEAYQAFAQKEKEALAKVNSVLADKAKDRDDKASAINDTIKTMRSKKLDQLEVENQIKSLETQVNETEVQLKLKSEVKPSEDTLKRLQESKKHDEDALKVQEKRHDDLKQTLEILEFWKTAFSDAGIKSMLIDVAIPHMNRCVREELDRVCPGTFTVSFDTLSQTKSGTIRDKFAINITHNLKCATGHKKLSGGEKRIIDFCCMAALRSLAEKLYQKQFCHIFYDEVLDSLDSESRELFCRSMKTQSSDERHVLLVTHALTEDVEPDRVFPF